MLTLKHVLITYIKYSCWHCYIFALVCFLCGETGVPGGNAAVWLGDHLTYRCWESNLGCSCYRRI